jgi:hypothetical protein
MEQVLCNSVSERHTLVMGTKESVPYYINCFPDLVWATEVQFQIERKRLEWLGCILNASSKSDLQIFRKQKKNGKTHIKMARKQKEWTTQIERKVGAKE